jgi:nanoRNase/pAp phosphatase (c-di-AMP/oligoRNAs hydrolase)
MPNKPIDSLVALLKQAPDEIFIQPHNIPDPDAIAASYGLQVLLKEKGLETVIVYEQELAKANSLRMLDIFRIEMKQPSDVSTLGEEDWTGLIDVQKENSNLTDLVTEEVACIDHHSDNGFDNYRFKDVRTDYGSCSAIIADYWKDSGLPIPVPVATALIYGIRSDTDGLSRGVSLHDIEAYYSLYGQADMSRITELDNNSIHISVLKNYSAAFETVEVYGTTGFICLESDDDSLLGSAGDILLSVQDVDIVVAYAIRKNGLKYSIRSIDSRISAADLVRHLVGTCGIGGGHATMAGGFIPSDRFPENRSYGTYTRVRAIEYIEKDILEGRR